VPGNFNKTQYQNYHVKLDIAFDANDATTYIVYDVLPLATTRSSENIKAAVNNPR